MIAQITVLPTEADWAATGLLQYSGWHALFEYTFTIREPATLTLIALGGFALLRRRGG